MFDIWPVNRNLDVESKDLDEKIRRWSRVFGDREFQLNSESNFADGDFCSLLATSRIDRSRVHESEPLTQLIFVTFRVIHGSYLPRVAKQSTKEHEITRSPTPSDLRNVSC